MTSRLIEKKFPIQDISNLAIPERSSYKPIYQISKWFARRSSSTFRAILLGSILDSSKDLMKNFYSEHDFSNITVLDPFMGGGTTIIEGLRLGMNCIGIDINPVAWFITKTEAELVDIKELKKEIEACEEKIGNQIRKWYITKCPACERQADIIYIHWVSLITCIFCKSSISLFRNYIVGVKGQFTSILCPECETVFNCLSPVKEIHKCPNCDIRFNPQLGTRDKRNSCKCRKCGKSTPILENRKKSQERIPNKMFAIEGFCSQCAADPNSQSPLKETRYKFFKRISKSDVDLYIQAESLWEKRKNDLLWPKESIPLGSTTSTLINHNYTKWEELYNRRQLLALSTILNYISNISDDSSQDMFLAAFINLLNHNNVFTRYSPKGQKVEGIFARHDFHPLSTHVENNVWGTKYGRGTWIKCLNRLLKGKQYNITPYDSNHVSTSKNRKRLEKIYSGIINGKLVSENFVSFPSKERNLLLLCQDSASISDLSIQADLIVSDPPYADNVNYSELSDFFYVWIRLILVNRYPLLFSVEETPKLEEAIISKNRKLDYYNKLIEIFKVAKTKLSNDGLFVFTFHHSDIQKWFKLYEVISKAGLCVIKTHSIPSEARNVLNIQNKKANTFDLIIVCRTQLPESVSQISVEKFKSNIKFHYKKRLNQLADANIKIYGLDWLSIFFGVLLEQKSEFVVNTSTEQNISIQEAFEACRDIVNTD